MKAPASAPFASEEMARWRLHADLYLGIGYAMSLLELKGWLPRPGAPATSVPSAGTSWTPCSKKPWASATRSPRYEWDINYADERIM